MPRVPTLDVQTAPTNLPNAQINTGVVSPEQSQRPFRDAQRLGGAVGAMGEKFGAIGLQAQQEANELRVQDAINRAKEAAITLTFDKDIGYTNVKGIDALNRKSGKPLADEYADQLRERMSTIEADLGNDAQRIAFGRRAAELATSFHGDAVQHEGTQFREYALSVREGTVKNNMNEIGLYYDKPDRIDQSVLSIKAAVADQGRMMGKSAEWIEARTREMTSAAHALAVQTALEKNNAVYADNYMKKYSKDMSADDILKVQGGLTKQLDSEVALTTAQSVMKEAHGRIVTSGSDRAFNILIDAESGGKQTDAGGNPTTSPKGAIGVAQVMPATAPEAAKLAGVEWNENLYKTDADYNMQLGKAYFEKQLQDFNGNLAYAYAAYNAGPGATRNAIDKAEKEGGDWLALLPKETQNYVSKNVAKYNEGGGSFKRPSLIDLQNRVSEVLGTSNPARVKLAQDEVERMYNATTKAIEQQAKDNKANAMEALINNGGQFNALPASVKANIAPEDYASVMDFASKVAKGTDPATDWGLYYQLKVEPQTLADTNLYTFRDRLSDTEFKELVKMQEDVRSGKEDTISKIMGTKDILTMNLKEIGISEKDNPAEFGKVWAMLEKRVTSREQQLRRTLTPQEQREEVSRMFTEVDVPGYVYGTRKMKYADAVANDVQIKIPTNEREQIVNQLKAQNLVPTEDVVMAIYKRKHGVH